MRLPQLTLPAGTRFRGTGVTLSNRSRSEFQFTGQADARGIVKEIEAGPLRRPLGGFDIVELYNADTGQRLLLKEFVTSGRQPGWGPIIQDDKVDLLHVAVVYGWDDLVERLLAGGYPPDLKKEDTEATPLHYAAGKGAYDIAVQLINAGAQINARDNKGLTPFKVAEIERSHRVFELLQDHGGTR